MTQKPSSDEILRAIDETDALLEIAGNVLEDGTTERMQFAISTVLKASRERLAAIAFDLDHWIERESARADLTPPEHVNSAAVELAARWFADQNPPPSPALPLLRSRFDLSVEEACEAIVVAQLLRTTR